MVPGGTEMGGGGYQFTVTPGRVANRARPALKPARRLQRFIIGPAGFIAGRPALKRAGRL